MAAVGGGGGGGGGGLQAQHIAFLASAGVAALTFLYLVRSRKRVRSFYGSAAVVTTSESEETWFSADERFSEKTDLLHRGHAKGGKLVIAMVGVPGTGKTYIARKVARYLRWINYRTKVFSLAKLRQDRFGPTVNAEFYDEDNDMRREQRRQFLQLAVEQSIRFLNKGGEVAILDGSNTTLAKRQLIRDRVAKEDGYEIIWIECICQDESIIQQNIQELQESPDFHSLADFQERVALYRQSYERVQEDEGCFVKVFDDGRKLEVNESHGFLRTKIIAFLMNLHNATRPVYLTRHGESEFNVKGLIGGDSDLSAKGELYADALADYIAQQADAPSDSLCVWSSTMKRARKTATRINCARYVEWRALREIEVGVCDGLSYAMVQKKWPAEYRAREQDKLRYRYPRGESYIDLTRRLEPVLFELERQREPLIIVAHQAVLRALYAYFLDLNVDEIPYLDVPLHTLIRLEPKAYGCREKRVKLLVED